jgi:two-component system phosphate regulon sensor histidine kinase PhoR
MTSRRGVLAALAGASLLAAILLGFGLLQLAELAAQGGSRLEIFAFAIVLALTALVLPAACGWFAFRMLDRQIVALTQGVDAAFAGSGPRVFASVGGHGSAGELASALTRLVSDLAVRVEDGRREGRLLVSVIGAMKEGMVVLGPDRKIRVANDAFRQLFRTPFDPVGRLLAEVVRDPAVFRELEAALPPTGEIRETLLHLPGSGKTFELRVSPLGAGQPEPPSSLILFFDVTRLEALERVRRDFVADVSHELRTPLTSIKAFVENLIEERLADSAEALRFLEIVRKHADRMGDLIDDLTDLSLIETGSVTLDVTRLDAAAVAREVAAQLAFRARAADVEIQLDLPVPFLLDADRRRLEQVLVNLVDNAIKFNKRGGRVRVGGEIADDHPRIAIEDSGVGIPPDALEQVFHRFFRVDTARSRELGGTGLGLAIVKHLMRLHDGRVTVASEPGRGSTFTLEFPPLRAERSEDQGDSSAGRASGIGWGGR